MVKLILAASACMLISTPVVPQWQSVDGGLSHQLRCFWNDTANDRLLVSGNFPFAQGGSLRVNNIAWWDGTAWSGDGLANGNGNQAEFGTSNPVYSIVMLGDTVFAGHLGDIWHGQLNLRYATMLVNEEWLPCGEPNSIFFFLEANGRMFSGGVHDTLYGAYAPGIHEWRNGAFADMPNMPFTNPIRLNTVGYWHGQYYFGGGFSAFGSPRMVAFDGVDQWSGLGEGVGGDFISTICGFGDSLYIGGFFNDGPNVQSRHIQLWDGNTWKPFFPQVEYISAVSDIQVNDGALYISGIYHWVGETTEYGLLRYDGHQLCTIGGAMPSGDNTKMAFFRNDLYLGTASFFPGLEQEWIGRLPLEGLVPDRCLEVGPNAIRVVQEATEGQLIVYPNPTNGITSVDIPSSVVDGVLEVTDGLGRSVLRQNIAGRGRQDIDLSHLATGSYTVALRSAKSTVVGRIVKMW